MIRRRRTTPKPSGPAADWTRATVYRINGRILTPGVEFSVRGERGRYKFVHATTNASGVTWVDALGGPRGERAWRSFYPERIKRVHRIAKYYAQ